MAVTAARTGIKIAVRIRNNATSSRTRIGTWRNMSMIIGPIAEKKISWDMEGSPAGPSLIGHSVTRQKCLRFNCYHFRPSWPLTS